MKAPRLIAIVGALLITGAANAQNRCSSYIGQVETPQTFNDVTAAFANLKPKDEFETTAQYDARKAAALASTAGLAIISMAQARADDTVYDADTQTLQIMNGAFSNGGFDTSSAFRSANINIPTSPFQNFEAVVAQSDTPTGAYAASNAYGAGTTVTKISRKSEVIFDSKEPDVLGNDLFPTAARNAMKAVDRMGVFRYVIGGIPLSPDAAKIVKPTLKFALVVRPKEPYFVQGTHFSSFPTIQNPREVQEQFSILFADFQCGLVMDSNNKVLGAYPMKQM